MFVDQSSRVFAMGQNRYGKLGQEEHELVSEEESEAESSEVRSDEGTSITNGNGSTSRNILLLGEVRKGSGDQSRASVMQSSQNLTPMGGLVRSGASDHKDVVDCKDIRKCLIENAKEEWHVIPVQLYDFAKPGSKVAAVQCGPGHTLAATKQGDLYSWGEGFEGKLGLGYNEEQGTCGHQNFPKRIRGRFGKDKHGRRIKEAIASAGCAKNFTVVVADTGRAFMWGRGEFWPYEFDQLKHFSRPFQICESKKIQSVSVGLSHYMLIDQSG